MKIKVEHGVLALGLLVLVGAVGYVFTRSSETVSPSSLSASAGNGARVTFKQYQSNDFGFSILYPDTWSYSRQNAGLPSKDYSAIVFNAPGVRPSNEEGVLPNIAVNYYRDLGVLLSFEGEKFTDQTLEGYLATSKVVKEISTATLTGLPAWRGKVAAPNDGSPIDTVFVEHVGHVFAIAVSNRQDFDPRIEDAMIASFKFNDLK